MLRIAAALLFVELALLTPTSATAAPPPALPQAQEPTFKLERNATLETLHIMALLTPSWKTPDIGVRPLADEARTHFARYSDHPSVHLFGRAMRESKQPWIQWIQVMGILALSSKRQVPNASFDPQRIGFPDFNYPKQNAATAEQLMQAVNRFYRDAKVEAFRRRTQPAYDCAFAQVRRDLPVASILSVMERYYGTSLRRYSVLPSPLMNLHINMNVRVAIPRGYETHWVVAPSKLVKTAEEFGCGFEWGSELKWLTLHEYGHSFVNPVLEAPALKPFIDRHAHLLAPIKREVEAQGMSDWFGAVIEHVVRLGEIRILESVGDKEGAQQRRLNQVFERDFIYLPLLEKRVQEYEADRKRYPTYASFIERLLDAFSDLPSPEAGKAAAGTNPD